MSRMINPLIWPVPVMYAAIIRALICGIFIKAAKSWHRYSIRTTIFIIIWTLWPRLGVLSSLAVSARFAPGFTNNAKIKTLKQGRQVTAGSQTATTEEEQTNGF